MNQQYCDYLNSPAWFNRRTGCILKAGKCCEVCSGTERLQAHHLTYANIFDEPLRDLMCLCKPCHTEAELWIKAGEIPRTGDVDYLRNLTFCKLKRRTKEVVVRAKPIIRPLLSSMEVMMRNCHDYGKMKVFLRFHFKGKKKKGQKVKQALDEWRRADPKRHKTPS